jgi:hypothetical protein
MDSQTTSRLRACMHAPSPPSQLLKMSITLEIPLLQGLQGVGWQGRPKMHWLDTGIL